MRLSAEQETYLYKLLGQISSRKCGGVSAEIGSPIFRGVGEQRRTLALAPSGFDSYLVGWEDGEDRTGIGGTCMQVEWVPVCRVELQQTADEAQTHAAQTRQSSASPISPIRTTPIPRS
jgi:hypothetical protein